MEDPQGSINEKKKRVRETPGALAWMGVTGGSPRIVMKEEEMT